ncbi:hypothetical protein AB9P05_03805 [Roseivirga sp. BDSF3-8]|uniref:hypothetical protein n=1 Tax=Roseivirga sp. BDSF3-8 TaxID=3241598 RepID=UPI0035320542
MKKLKLEDLAISSFQTAEKSSVKAGAEVGTSEKIDNCAFTEAYWTCLNPCNN